MESASTAVVEGRRPPGGSRSRHDHRDPGCRGRRAGRRPARGLLDRAHRRLDARLQPEDLLLSRAHRRDRPAGLRRGLRGRHALPAPRRRQVRPPRRRRGAARASVQPARHGHRRDLGPGRLGRVVGLGAAPDHLPPRLSAVQRLLRAARLGRRRVAARHLRRPVCHRGLRRRADHLLCHALPAGRAAPRRARPFGQRHGRARPDRLCRRHGRHDPAVRRAPAPRAGHRSPAARSFASSSTVWGDDRCRSPKPSSTSPPPTPPSCSCSSPTWSPPAVASAACSATCGLLDEELSRREGGA